jgi:phosphoribosyl-AMP cyclohydrolase
VALRAPPAVTLRGVNPEELTYDDRGLIPAIVQQHDTGEVLMLAWMTAETLAETLELGETVFWSRSRAERWHKGATSGNIQRVIDVVADCDADVVLLRVDQTGAGACHTGARSCFGQPVELA